MDDVYEKYFKSCNLTKLDSDVVASLFPEPPVKQILIDIPIGLKESVLMKENVIKRQERSLDEKGAALFLEFRQGKQHNVMETIKKQAILIFINGQKNIQTNLSYL